jgi:hypothetical protein
MVSGFTTVEEELAQNENEAISRSDSSASSTRILLSKLLPWMYNESSLDILGRQGRKALIHSVIQAVVIIPLLVVELVIVSVRVGPKLFKGSVYKRAGFIPLYAFVSICAQMFVLGLSLEAAKYKNTIQVVFIAVFNIIHLLICALQTYEWKFFKTYLQDKGTPYAYLDILPIMHTVNGLMVCFSIISCWNAHFIYREFTWCLFERNGASISKKRILALFHAWSVLLKLCWFFNFTFVLQIMWGLILDKIDKNNAPLLLHSTALWWTWSFIVFTTSVVFVYNGQKAMAQGWKGICIIMFSCLTLNSVLISLGVALVDQAMFMSIIYYVIFFAVVSVTLNTIATIFGILCFIQIKNGLPILGIFSFLII